MAQSLICPSCYEDLLRQGHGYVCQSCQTSYPDLGGLPWLFAAAREQRSQWRLRLIALLNAMERETDLLRASFTELNRAGAGDHQMARRRLGRLLEARSEHRRGLLKLLQPLDISSASAGESASRTATSTSSADLAEATATLQTTQTLTSYYDNLLRDWVWGDVENRLALEALIAASGQTDTDKTDGSQTVSEQATGNRTNGEHSLGATLVLGSGAGRLSFDLATLGFASHVTAVDINPLLHLTFKKILQGSKVSLYEFPVAPTGDAAVKQRLKAPDNAEAKDIDLVFADLGNLPFPKASFDTVVTPWLIDIVDLPLPGVVQAIARVLRPGGLWLNSGSRNFEHRSPEQRWSKDEIVRIVKDSGFFELSDWREQRQPYLQSPHSAHWRTELVTTFAGRRLAAPAGSLRCE